MVFTVSTKNYIGNHETIVRHDDKRHEIPVLYVIPGEIDFPGDKKKLAANVASIMNGNEPLFEVDIGPNRIFWKKTEKGCELRVQEDGCHTSKIAAVLSFADRQDRVNLLPEAICGSCRTTESPAAEPFASSKPELP